MAHIGRLLDDTTHGYRLTEAEAALLLKVKGRDIWKVVAAADEVREARVGDTVTYVLNQNIHISNICKNLCGFCGFGRPAGAPGAYCDDEEILEKKINLAVSRGVTEICLLSGVNPDFTLETFEGFIALTRRLAPGVHIHAFSPDEVMHAAAKSGLSTREVLERFRAAGLGSLQGTAAEILVDEVREVICPRKVSTNEWVNVIREAHAMGIPTTSTIMYGSCESPEDQARHLGVLREIEDDTRGFTELVLLTYVHQNTPLYQAGKARAGATGREDILMTAVSRLFLDNFQNIQVAWGKLGLKTTQLALIAGANDLAGTMFSDDVTGDAGAAGSDYLDPNVMERIVSDIGRVLRQRTTEYRLI